MQWFNGDRPRPGATGTLRRPPGRPRTAEDLCELVLRIARETGWGYTKFRVIGPLAVRNSPNVNRVNGCPVSSARPRQFAAICPLWPASFASDSLRPAYRPGMIPGDDRS